jgi:hypothetical protein
MAQQIALSGFADPLSITLLLMNLGIGVFLSVLLSWHYKRFGSTLSNREEFSKVFPFILLTTTLIITVVKSSLALSLGLVGALSIVRFRTPVKEPEELAYLFIAIAIGLGLGANQTIPTIIAGIVILTIVALLKWTRREEGNKNLYLSIDWKNAADDNSDRYLERLNEVISKHVLSCDLRRFDVRHDHIEVTYILDIASTEKLNSLVFELRQLFPLMGVTFLDQNQLPSV